MDSCLFFQDCAKLGKRLGMVSGIDAASDCQSCRENALSHTGCNLLGDFSVLLEYKSRQLVKNGSVCCLIDVLQRTFTALETGRHDSSVAVSL